MSRKLFSFAFATMLTAGAIASCSGDDTEGDNSDGSGGSTSTGGDTASGGAATGGDAATGGNDSGCNEPVSETALEAIKVADAPTLDGIADDDAWGCVPELKVAVNANIVYTPEGCPDGEATCYPGLKTTDVHMKAVYTDTDLYLVATWEDPTKSLARFPWVKADDGTWKQATNKDSSGHENTYYEDKLAVQWNINTPAFASSGCFASCHLGGSQPRKYNSNPGELTDMWHWKSVRTEPNGQLDDKHIVYMDDGMGGAGAAAPNGRVADAKDGGGYTDNKFAKFDADCLADPDGSLSLPCFMNTAGETIADNDEYWIFGDDKVKFVDGFAAGDEIAGMVTDPFVGARGEVSTQAVYADGVWTLEIKRSLTTSAEAETDVQFDDLAATYEFGVAVFDNTQINHAAHGSALKLTFRK